MSENEPYATARGVDTAIREAARRAAVDNPALSTDQRIRLEHFNRFLSRVFSEGPNSDWVLKGAVGSGHCRHRPLPQRLWT